MVFKSPAQRKAFFAMRSQQQVAPRSDLFTVFSYRDGKKLGKFNNLQELFNRFTSEKKAFDRVMKFRRRTGIQVNTIQDIKKQKRMEKIV